MQGQEPVLQGGNPVRQDVHRIPGARLHVITDLARFQRRSPFDQDGVRAEIGEVRRHHKTVLQEHPRTILDASDFLGIHHLAATLLVQPDEPHPVLGTHRPDGERELIAHPTRRNLIGIAPFRVKEVEIPLRTSRKKNQDDHHCRPTNILRRFVSHTTHKSHLSQFLHGNT